MLFRSAAPAEPTIYVQTRPRPRPIPPKKATVKIAVEPPQVVPTFKLLDKISEGEEWSKDQEEGPVAHALPNPRRRPPTKAGGLHDPPCSTCKRLKNDCAKEVGKGACYRCMQLKRRCDYSKRGDLHSATEDENEEVGPSSGKKYVDKGKGKGKAKAIASDTEEKVPPARAGKKTSRVPRKKIENFKNKTKQITAMRGRKYAADDDDDEDRPAPKTTKSSKKWVDVSDDEMQDGM